MAEVVYIACAVLSVVCAVMLLRGYRATRTKLLLWSSLCFVALAVQNTVLFIDMIVIPDVDLGAQLWRTMLSGLAGSLLLFGLIWELT